MARIPLNFNEIEERSFPVYPPGTYTLRITEMKMESSKSSGELKETVKFEIVDGPNGSPEFAGKTLITSYSLQQKAGFRFVRLLSACGIPKERMTDVDDQELVGCVIRASVAQEMYNGRPTNRVQNEDPLNGPATAGATAGAALPQAPFAATAPPTPAGPPPGFVQGAAPPAAPGGAPAPGQWAPNWGAQAGQPQTTASSVPQGFNAAAPTPPPAKPVG